MSNGKKTVCCEQLTFLLKGLVAGRLRNTLFANLNSDLPLVFWWQGDLTPRFEQRLYTLIDRFIFDSSEWSTPKKSYETVLAAATEVQRRFIIQDLAWTRSYYMRVAFASIFDEAIAKKEAENIRSVSVIVGEGYYTTGALLLAWLVRQMKWTLNEKLSEEEFIFETPTGAFVFANLKEEGAVPVSELGVASEVASFLVHQPEGAMYIEQVSQLGENVSHLTTNTGKSDRLSLVADQLARGGSNTLLKKVLPMFLKLLPS